MFIFAISPDLFSLLSQRGAAAKSATRTIHPSSSALATRQMEKTNPLNPTRSPHCAISRCCEPSACPRAQQPICSMARPCPPSDPLSSPPPLHPDRLGRFNRRQQCTTTAKSLTRISARRDCGCRRSLLSSWKISSPPHMHHARERPSEQEPGGGCAAPDKAGDGPLAISRAISRAASAVAEGWGGVPRPAGAEGSAGGRAGGPSAAAGGGEGVMRAGTP